jgi:hypothetical protein
MRRTISAIMAVIGSAIAGAAPAMACDTCGIPAYSYQPAPYQPAPYQPPYACGGGCGQGYSYQAYGYRGQSYGYGTDGFADDGSFERLAEPTTQYYPVARTYPTTRYYYVNQGPTFTGPGRFAPYPTYQERAVNGYGYPRYHHYYHGAGVAGPAVYGRGGHRNGWSTAGYYHGKRVLRRYN